MWNNVNSCLDRSRCLIRRSQEGREWKVRSHFCRREIVSISEIVTSLRHRYKFSATFLGVPPAGPRTAIDIEGQICDRKLK